MISFIIDFSVRILTEKFKKNATIDLTIFDSVFFL